MSEWKLHLRHSTDALSVRCCDKGHEKKNEISICRDTEKWLIECLDRHRVTVIVIVTVIRYLCVYVCIHSNRNVRMLLHACHFECKIIISVGLLCVVFSYTSESTTMHSHLDAFNFELQWTNGLREYSYALAFSYCIEHWIRHDLYKPYIYIETLTESIPLAVSSVSDLFFSSLECLCYLFCVQFGCFGYFLFTHFVSVDGNAFGFSLFTYKSNIYILYTPYPIWICKMHQWESKLKLLAKQEAITTGQHTCNMKRIAKK